VRQTKPQRHDAATAAIWLNAGRFARISDVSSTAMPAPPRITHAVLAIPAGRVRQCDPADVAVVHQVGRQQELRRQRRDGAQCVARGNGARPQAHAAEDDDEVEEERRGDRRGGQQRHGRALHAVPEPVRQFVADDPHRDAGQECRQQARAGDPIRPRQQHAGQDQGLEQREGEGEVDQHARAGRACIRG